MKHCYLILVWLLFAFPFTGFSGMFDAEVKSRSGHIQGDSYFIIYATTDVSANTGASAVINAYNDIRRASTTIPVYLCLNNDGQLPEKDIQWYIEHVYNIPIATDTKTTAIVSNTALNSYLQYEGSIAKVFFVKNGYLIYRQNAKHHLVADQGLPIADQETWDRSRFPEIRHEPGVKHKVKKAVAVSTPVKGLKEIGTFKLNTALKLSSLDIILPAEGNSVYLLTDIQNELVKYHLDSAKVIARFNRPDDGAGLFCKMIADLPEECDTAYKYQNQFLNKVNRKSYYIFNVSRNKNNVVLSAGLQVFVVMKKDLVMNNNDEARTKEIIIRKGDIFGYGYNLFSVLDTNLSLIRHYYAPEGILPDSNIAPSWDYGLWFRDSMAVTLASPLSGNQYPSSFDRMFSFLKLNDSGRVSFERYAPTKVTERFKKNISQSLYMHHTLFNGRTLFVTDVDNAIFSLDAEAPVAYLEGGKPDIAEYIPQSAADDRKLLLNYLPYRLSSDSNHLYAVFKYQDKSVLINVFDKKFDLLKTIDISGLDPVSRLNKEEDGGNVAMLDNRIYIKYKKGANSYISVYEIEI